MCPDTVVHAAGKVFRFWPWPSNVQRDVVGRSRKTTMETTRFKQIRFRSDPIQTSSAWQHSRVECVYNSYCRILQLSFCPIHMLFLIVSIYLRFSLQLQSTLSTSNILHSAIPFVTLLVHVSTSCSFLFMPPNASHPSHRGIRQKVSMWTSSPTECSRWNTVLDRDAWLSPNR